MRAPDQISLVHGAAAGRGDGSAPQTPSLDAPSPEARPNVPRAARRRILLLRSGRHLRVAMDSLAARYPDCHIGVVGTPGSPPAIEQAGIAPGDTFFYDATRFQPAAFCFSRTAWAVRRWRYDQVAILWNDPDGQGQGNVERTALALSPRGYLAVTPDGTVVERALWPHLRTEGARLIATLFVGTFLTVFLYAPALAITAVRSVFAWRRSAPRKGAPQEVSGTPAERPTDLLGPSGCESSGRSVVIPFKRPEVHR